MEDPLLKKLEVCEQIRIKKPTLDAWLSQGKFPKGIKLNGRIRVWRLSDIEKFLQEQGAKA